MEKQGMENFVDERGDLCLIVAVIVLDGRVVQDHKAHQRPLRYVICELAWA